MTSYVFPNQDAFPGEVAEDVLKWAQNEPQIEKRYAEGADRINDPLKLVFQTGDDDNAVYSEIYASREVLSIRSDYFKSLLSGNKCPSLTLLEDDPHGAVSFVEEIHKLSLSNVKDAATWRKTWVDLAVKWRCPDFTTAFSNLIESKLGELCRLYWVPLNKSEFKERPLALVGCKIENWHHIPLQHKGLHCEGVITEAVSSCIFYIKSEGQILKVNLGSAPENCRVLMHISKRSDDEIKLFWEMIEASLTYPELHPQHQLSFTITNTKDLIDLLSSGQCWSLWAREPMKRLLSNDDLLDLSFKITHFGEPTKDMLSFHSLKEKEAVGTEAQLHAMKTLHSTSNTR